jgi:mRNA-degrading endonuclease toxin of MazEF toxin-antitoxin module
VRRGEVYRTGERPAERGNKPGYYVVVSRNFVARNEDISTVVCAPVYGELLGLPTEVSIGPEAGVGRHSSVRCDFLMLMFKHKLTRCVGELDASKLDQLDRALATALEISAGPRDA